ncbi:MAG TPA: NAD(P)-binding domain-containing protein [Kofleriaceae bacterium]|nr:NAD(P)-binding domain-containing protein [Kofleriaceae bacterium]
MRRTTTIVIGAGHAGLAMSRCLTERAIDHVVLERGAVANTWRTERWDSLRLLTPNWQSRLPGLDPDCGPNCNDPDGFRTMPEVIAFLDRYAQASAAPVQTDTQVTAVRRTDAGYLVRTDRGDWHCRTLVLATGACNLPCTPRVAEALPPAIRTLTPMDYRKPEQLEDGGVLVVGASATGVQLAEEIHRSGRPVTLAVGEHIRAPRTYRGRDIQWWMDAAGVLDQRYDEIEDLVRARKVPSLQLVGSLARPMLDLNALTGIGVRLVGRVAGVSDDRLLFSGSLANQCALSDLKLGRLLDTIDRWATERGLDGEVEAPHRFAPTRVESSPPLNLDLRRGAIRTILWASGYRPDYAWLEVPVLDRKGQLRHDGGVVSSAGMYVMGLPFLRRRKSALIDGAAADARDLSDHLVAYLNGRVTEAVA